MGQDPKTHPYSRQGVQACLTLEKAGFEQVPCGSTHNSDANVTGTVKFAAIDVVAEAMKIS